MNQPAEALNPNNLTAEANIPAAPAALATQEYPKAPEPVVSKTVPLTSKSGKLVRHVVVAKGDCFLDCDHRENGRSFEVVGFDGDEFALVLNRNTLAPARIRLDRLVRAKNYKKIG